MRVLSMPLSSEFFVRNVRINREANAPIVRLISDKRHMNACCLKL